MKSISCKHCGSDNVYRSRISYWSKDKGAWIDEEFADDYRCNVCGGGEMEVADVPEEDE